MNQNADDQIVEPQPSCEENQESESLSHSLSAMAQSLAEMVNQLELQKSLDLPVDQPLDAANIEELTTHQIEHMLSSISKSIVDLKAQHNQAADNHDEASNTVATSENKHTAQDKKVDEHLGMQEADSLYASAILLYKKKHFVNSVRLMRQAAMKGHLKAQFYTGIMFEKGNGLPQSSFHAYSWLALAASQGVAEAKEAKSQLEKKLSAIDRNAALKLAAERYETIEDLNHTYS